MADQKVATDVAESEFERFTEAMDLDVDTSRMDKDEAESFRQLKRKVTRAIENGHLVVDDKGRPVYTPQIGDKSPITFYEPTGVSLLAVDKKKAGENVAKTYATMADMTQTDAKTFASMNARDLKVCQAIYLLFLA